MSLRGRRRLPAPGPSRPVAHATTGAATSRCSHSPARSADATNRILLADVRPTQVRPLEHCLQQVFRALVLRCQESSEGREPGTLAERECGELRLALGSLHVDLDATLGGLDLQQRVLAQQRDRTRIPVRACNEVDQAAKLDEAPAGLSPSRKSFPRLLRRGDAEPEDPPDLPVFPHDAEGRRTHRVGGDEVDVQETRCSKLHASARYAQARPSTHQRST